MKSILFAAVIGVLLTGGIQPSRANVRPTMSAVRVTDGAIKVDGRLDDWPAITASVPYQATANTADHTNYNRTEAGLWRGPEDLTVTVRTAHDSKYLYVAGIVRDQLLFNDTLPEDPWAGDAFEIFIDANPVDKQFQKGTNGNFAQLILIPAHINQFRTPIDNPSGVFVWPQGKYNGVLAASRITPFGYTIEVAIPKADIPNWNAEPDLGSIGFDVSADDLDTPGVFGHDAGPKAIMFLLSPTAHFLSAEQLASLQLDRAVTKSKAKREPIDPTIPGYAKAQTLLDNFSDPKVGAQANAALANPDLARKAALYILMRRPELALDTKKLIVIIDKPTTSAPAGMMLDGRIYAMVALAKRHAFPVIDALGRFGASDDILLRNTAVYCAGLNGDKSAVPGLVKLYPTNPGSRTQEIIAASLAELGDSTGVPTLEANSWRDRGQITSKRDLELLKQLGIDYTPKAQ